MEAEDGAGLAATAAARVIRGGVGVFPRIRTPLTGAEPAAVIFADLRAGHAAPRACAGNLLARYTRRGARIARVRSR